MFLKKLELTNFKSHAHLALDFAAGNAPAEDQKSLPANKGGVRKTTFLLGENGTGKTAVLQAIALLTGGSEALWFSLTQPDDYIQAGKSYCELSATIATAQGDERTLSLRLNRGESRAEALARARTTLAPMDAALRHTSRSYFTAGYGSGRRLDTQGLLAGHTGSPQPRFTAVHSLFRKNSLLRPLDECLQMASQEGGPAAVTALRDALNTFLPGDVRLRIPGTESGTPLFETPAGLLPLHLLSNGYQQTVAWVIDLLYHVTRVFGNYKQPLTARGLLLIDEIDLHLHPQWQAQLYRFLAENLPNFQIVATAYAPATTEHAQADEVVVLRREVLAEAGNQVPLLFPDVEVRIAA